MLHAGDIAPEIDAQTSAGTRFRLSEQKDKLCTIIYFFPKAFTPGCTLEAKSFRDNYPELLLGGASLVGISTDSHDTQCLFAQSLRAPFPLIGDKDKSIARAYDVLWPIVGLSRRVTYVVSALRTIEAVLHHEINIGQHRDEVLRVMDRLRRSRARMRGSIVPEERATASGAKEPFELLEEAGAGAMGVVYRARERSSGRVVAVKLVGSGAVDRFMRESVLLSKLAHPSIVSYVSHGTADDGRLFLAMEWLEGESLEARLRRERLSLAESLRIGEAVASALAAAHRMGVFHRDIKPSNVFLTKDGAVKVLDFGIARSTGNISTKLTRTGQLLGTPGYAAPEQIRGAALDGRADLFALGCLLYRCIAGRSAFKGDDTFSVLYSVLNTAAPHLEGVPPEVDELVQWLLAKEPSQRPASAEETRAAIVAFLSP